MKKVDIAGLKIDSITKPELLEQLSHRLATGQKTFLTTPYSEFLYRILWSPKDLAVLNQADYAVADGIGIIWAAKYFSIPLTAKNYWLKIFQACWQALWTLGLALLRPARLKTVVPEKIVGADLVWDLAGLAEKTQRSLYLLGGFGNTPRKAADKLLARFPGLHIAGCSAKNPDDFSIKPDLLAARPDILLVAFGPLKQEQWIAENLPDLPVGLAVGLGGTFDYLAGEKPLPPKFIRNSGLEWLWRLLTQKGRAGRIWNATWGMVSMCVSQKIFSTLPYRENVVSVITNPEGKVFIGRFNPNHPAKKVFPLSGENSFSGRWQFPQGGIEPGESLVAAARREAREETGIRSLELLGESTETFSYQWPADHALFTPARFRYRGQRQHLVYFQFAGKDSDIKIDQNEFVDFRWAEPETLRQALHPSKAGLAEIALQDLKKLGKKAII